MLLVEPFGLLFGFKDAGIKRIVNVVMDINPPLMLYIIHHKVIFDTSIATPSIIIVLIDLFEGISDFHKSNNRG